MAFVVALALAIFVLPAPWGFVTVLVGAFVEVAEAFFWIRLSRRGRVQVGPEALIGAEARVVSACRPEGKVRVEGELWRARCEAGADLGETVRVRALDGLTLVVGR